MKSKQWLHQAKVINTLSTLNIATVPLIVTYVLVINMHSSVTFFYMQTRGLLSPVDSFY